MVQLAVVQVCYLRARTNRAGESLVDTMALVASTDSSYGGFVGGSYGGVDGGYDGGSDGFDGRSAGFVAADDNGVQN